MIAHLLSLISWLSLVALIWLTILLPRERLTWGEIIGAACLFIVIATLSSATHAYNKKQEKLTWPVGK